MPIPDNYSTPVRSTAKDRTLSQLQKWIIDGTLQPDEKLNDAELAAALGVSRTPVREALQLLEAQGLVQMFPGKDTRVTRIDKDDIHKPYAPLGVLHALAAEMAAQLIQPEQIEQLRELNQAFAKCILEKDLYQALEYDEEFHNLIVEIADNSYITSFCSSLQLHIRRFKYVFLSHPIEQTQTAVQEHEQIIQALQDRDSATAARIIKQNLSRPLDEFHKQLHE
ncbi:MULTISPECIES: GntR family transcriptional regulator [Paenibacillus]|uniref:GntR family transcriptional regulator n=1 Tax=Paenibacillus TaxID=44249 RepID=UPI001C306DA8|nr:GntR family transcriptional regulator [Paenibacillus sp. GbtcB18]